MLLFEINHPAHIHLFKNLVKALKEDGIKSGFTIKTDKSILGLARHYNLSYIKVGKKGKGLLMKYVYQLWFLIKTVIIVRKLKIKIGLGVSMNLPLVSKFTKMQSIGFDDDDMSVTPVFAKYANRASIILTPSALEFEKRGENHIVYPGYHELAYLHPNRFNPDPSVLGLLNVEKEEIFFILRFNAFNAHHDIGESGIPFEQKKKLIKKLLEKGKVFISTESEIEPEFAKYKLPDFPEHIHSFMAFAHIYIGDSQTMTSEAAVLGTPALKCNTFAGKLSIPNELEQQYELCYSYLPADFEKMMEKLDELVALPDLKGEWRKRRKKMLHDKIDVTSFWKWIVMNNLSENKIAISKSPQFWNQFK